MSRLFVINLIKRALYESHLEIQPFLVEISHFTFRSNDRVCFFFFFENQGVL